MKSEIDENIKWNNKDIKCLTIKGSKTKDCIKVLLNKNIRNIYIIGDSHGEQVSLILDFLFKRYL